MRFFKYRHMLASILLFLCIVSCKKGLDFINNGYDRPNSQCLIAHTEDDLLGYSVNFHYNKKGDPDSINYSGLVMITEYDKKGRLVKTTFGTEGVHQDFFYTDNTFLPSVMKYYYPFFGGLIAIDSFQYNAIGELTKIGITNLIHPEYNVAEIFEYNRQHNVSKITANSQNGGTVSTPPYTVYEVLKYDDKPNYIAGNQWLKYILLNTDFDAAYLFTLFSVNNAVDWHWGFQGGYNAVTSTFEYDASGFATKINLHLFDTDAVTELLAFTKTSSSTCDILQKSDRSAFRDLKFVPQNINHLPLKNSHP